MSRPDHPTSAFSVGVCRAAQALPVRPPDALRRRTYLLGGRADSIHTARHDTDCTVLSCLAGGVNWALHVTQAVPSYLLLYAQRDHAPAVEEKKIL